MRRKHKAQLDLVAIAQRSARDQVRTLETLLALEQQRSADLFNRLLATVGFDGQTYTSPARPQLRQGEQGWNWADIQPEDEALEDVQGRLDEGSLTPNEAAAILEALGYPNVEVDIPS